MEINLRCSSCEAVSTVPRETLCAIWKQGYDQVDDDRKEEIFLSTEIKCVCGNVDKYSSPMYKYMFRVIFEEFLSQED